MVLLSKSVFGIHASFARIKGPKMSGCVGEGHPEKAPKDLGDLHWTPLEGPGM